MIEERDLIAVLVLAIESADGGGSVVEAALVGVAVAVEGGEEESDIVSEYEIAKGEKMR